MSKNNEKTRTKKHLCKVNKKWVAVATTSAALLGVGGIFPGIAGPGFETETVQAADEEINVPKSEWSANTVNEVEQEVEAQNSADTLSYQIRWGDTLSALSVTTGVSIDEIAAQNDIENPDLIYAGDFLSGETSTSQVTEEIESQEAFESEKSQDDQVEEGVVEETIEEQAKKTPATETEETSGAVEEVVEEEATEEQPEESPAEEAEETPEVEAEKVEEQTIEEDSEEAPAEEAEETTDQNVSVEEPDEIVESEETSEKEPVAKVEVLEDTDEEVVEREDVPKTIEEEVDVQEVTTTEETVEPDDEVVTDQSVAVVTEPESSIGFIQPAQGYVSSEYGYRLNPFSGQNRLHAGIDIAGSGTISAAQSGTVVKAEYHGSWGNYVKINHGNGYETLYAHMKNGSIPVSVGETVSQGQRIGTMGQTGSATGVHLHFEVYVNGVQVDPAPYL